MGRGGPELPESIDEAREILSDRAFFRPRSDLPAEPDERKAYVRRLHVVLARTARRAEHSRQMVAGERPLDSDPDLPGGPVEAEAALDGRSFFTPVTDLPDDADRIGEYVERLHVQLARAGTALRYNRGILKTRRADGESKDTSGTDAAVTGDADGPPDNSAERETDEGGTGDSQPDFGNEDTDTGADEYADTTDDAGAASATNDAQSDGATESGDETAGESPSKAVESDDTTGREADRTDNDNNSEGSGFVFGRSGGSSDEPSVQEADTPDDEAEAVSATETEQRSRLSGEAAGDGLTRRQVLVGGSVGAALTAAIGVGLATILLSDDGDDSPDDGTAETTGGDDSGTVGDETTDDGSGGDDRSGGDDGSTGDDGGVDDGGSGGDDGSADDSTGGDGGSDDGSGGGPGQDRAFELADFNVTAGPDEEYVELAYTGESERDISGYLLYDSEGGQADPTAQGTLDPFAFPEGTVLSPGASVRVYTGQGEDSDGVFYWGYEVNIWNQGGDTVVLEDASGSVVFEGQYPAQE